MDSSNSACAARKAAAFFLNTSLLRSAIRQ
ncbi:hypothetical protein CKAH01_18585 [Colletotrichum kahawae]|uniref:Uncharacterized protein n=1 Tax=Colletotrichum kahawae TaxID=34407 RepID=A0AAD9Y7E5_COLKA|nr:hypothetical protein CKAH01_18585 [Colletotrichum kahawae]